MTSGRNRREGPQWPLPGIASIAAAMLLALTPCAAGALSFPGFIENKGQKEKEVLYYATWNGANISAAGPIHSARPIVPTTDLGLEASRYFGYPDAIDPRREPTSRSLPMLPPEYIIVS